MLLAAGREVVSKTSAYNITKLSYRVEVCAGTIWKNYDKQYSLDSFKHVFSI